ncbi:MAG: hypothetical protein HOO96_24760, partial [Polyangiaceae bacterium]|nr:hypothetical protein [Polyangiaceae bacterium]
MLHISFGCSTVDSQESALERLTVAYAEQNHSQAKPYAVVCGIYSQIFLANGARTRQIAELLMNKRLHLRGEARRTTGLAEATAALKGGVKSARLVESLEQATAIYVVGVGFHG